MNKKILLIMIAFICCFVLSGCSMGVNEAELKDEYAPFLFKFKYPKKDYVFDADLDHAKYVQGTLKNEEKNIKIIFDFTDMSKSGLNSEMNYKSKKSNFKKTLYTNIGGYEYYDEKEYYGVSLFDMKTSDSMNCALTVIVSKLDSKNDANIEEFVNSKDFDRIMKSINLDTNVDGKKIDGFISDNHKLIVKNLKSEDGYSVKQYSTSGGVMSSYLIGDDKNKDAGAYFRVDYNELEKVYKSFDEMISSKVKSKEEYVSYDLFGLKVKKRVLSNNSSKKYSKSMQGYFERDEKIFSFSYYQYVGVKDEVGKKLVNDVLNNLEF